ncbi:TIGR02099 family protein [Pseudomonas monteilii]|uniref:YhdP family protein n=1 Tax=Pseudomonas TaxID=286 RepID=UPI0005355874|nr:MULTISPECIES: YhdP family protein [Pseudomonas]MBA1317914.1 TIGR02099 family protein [Pseudomonas monteilii]MCE1017588.1 TIGR02099 family protein [Pseudomonas monteilii]MCE1036912.1 TIGR02099 family protein [Pseudomonas monteilii]MCE1085747.1 TIGR02099 family protein [Pseudomonas monteilii]MDH0022807.1 YhdP family protein [Pseudomonas monteilii]
MAMGRLTRVLVALTRWGLGLCALLAVLVALYVSLGRELVPLVAEYRADVESKAEQALGLPVHVGALEGRWSGLAPVLRVRDLQLGEGATALRLDDVKVVPDVWASLTAREVRLARIQLGGLQLILRENEQGAWNLEGLPKKDDAPLDPADLLQRLRQLGRVDVFDSLVTLHPWQRDPLTLTYVSAGLQAGASRQVLELRATLPDGQPLSLNLQSRVSAKAWRDGQVEAYLSLPQSDWARWLPPRLLGEWQAEALRAGGEFWVDWRKGQLQQAVVRLNAPELRGAYTGRKAATLSNLALGAWFQRRDQGFDVVVDSLAMDIGKARWESHLQLQQRPGENAADENWRVQADRLDLTPLTPLIDALAPLPEKVMAVVDGLKVTGALRNVRLEARPKAEGDKRLQFEANLEKVGFDAYHNAPAAGNVSGSISGDLGHGELRLDTEAFMLHLYPIFAKPWHYQKANARLTWALDKDGFTLIAPYLKVLGEEGKIAGDFLIRLLFEEGREDYMDLRVGLTEGDGRYTAKYLPEVLSPALDEWLRSAIVKGTVDEGYFQYQGSLNHGAAPEARSISLFFKVRDAALDFQPGWPQVQHVDGDVFIEDSGVRIKAQRGVLLDTKVSDVTVDIPHVDGDQHSHLYLDGDFDGTLGDGLKILKEAPIGTGEIFAGWEGEGPLKGKVKLDIPLAHGPRPKVQVDFATNDARLKVAPPSLELNRLKGDFSFDFDKGLSGKGISLQAFGKPVTAQITAEGQAGQMQTRINANGQVSLKALTEWLQFKQALPASGDLPYQLQVNLGSRENSLSVTSNLKGLAIDLPAPFGKAVADTRDSRFSMNLQGAERRFDAAYTDLARFAYAAPADALAQGRGELLLGAGNAQVPAGQGLRIRGRLEALDLAPWQEQAARLAGDDPGGSARQNLQSVDLSIGQLKAFGMDLNQAVVRLARGGQAWDLRLDSKEVIGNARVPDAKGSPMVVRMQTLRLPAADPAQAQAEDGPDPLASFDPRKVPALDLSIDKLYRGDDLFGSASIKLRPTARGVSARDIDLDFKGLRIDGGGGWEGETGKTSSWYKGRLDGKNLADVLKAWGFAPTVTSRDFRLDVDGRWPGSPAAVGLERFSGSMDAALRTGQFVEVEGSAQALRVFGLLNFNSIGRRLRLDFSDLFEKGLAYDRVKGLLVASDGVYVTREPISVTGPSSNFELDGTLDMVRDRIDANLQVSLPVTNNLPLAALIVGAPAVGGALFLVDRLIGDRVSRFASVHYRVEGPVKEPRITFVKPFEKSR